MGIVEIAEGIGLTLQIGKARMSRSRELEHLYIAKEKIGNAVLHSTVNGSIYQFHLAKVYYEIAKRTEDREERLDHLARAESLYQS